MWAKIKALWTLKKTVDQASKEVIVNGKPRASWLTGEFWITILGNAPMIACTLRGHESWPCLALSAVVNLVYIYKRGTLKETIAEVGGGVIKKLAAEKVEPGVEVKPNVEVTVNSNPAA